MISPISRRSLLALPGIAWPTIVRAQGAESKAQRGERVVKEALAALGGDRYLAMRDRVESGRAYSFYRERLSGLSRTRIYTRYLTRPEPPTAGFFGLRMRQALGKDEDTAVVFLEDGKGWDVSYRGARPIPEVEVERFRETQMRGILYILRMRLGERGLIIESQGAGVEDNSPVEIVDITDADNKTVTVYFHQSTKLPLKQKMVRRAQGDRIEEVTIFAKFRDVGGGVMWPYTTERTRNGEKQFELFSESVEINRGLDDSLFTISADTKILKKMR
ncbi:MAG: hypothetical protein NTV70_14000 [Acidobacteria bacterium]|nr:hypothetical protein [Acidobacteriota bacterium]